MNKTIGILIGLGLLGLAVYVFSLSESDATEVSTSGPSSDTSTPAEAADEASQASDKADSSEAPTATTEETKEEAQCRVDPITNLINLSYQANVAEIGEDEWVLGQSDETAFTLIEYSDFQ